MTKGVLGFSSWSNNGENIAYIRTDQNNRDCIEIIDPNGKIKKKLYIENLIAKHKDILSIKENIYWSKEDKYLYLNVNTRNFENTKTIKIDLNGNILGMWDGEVLSASLNGKYYLFKLLDKYWISSD